MLRACSPLGLIIHKVALPSLSRDDKSRREAHAETSRVNPKPRLLRPESAADPIAHIRLFFLFITSNMRSQHFLTGRSLRLWLHLERVRSILCLGMILKYISIGKDRMFPMTGSNSAA